MKPFKIQKKVLHFFNNKVLYETKWFDSRFRFDSEDEAWKVKRQLDKEYQGKVIHRVIKNDVS